MGVGKTTVARAVAEALDRPLRDSDADIETLFGRTGASLAARHGVDELHRVEAAVLLGALAAEQPAVIAAAGWTVEDQRCREAMSRRAAVVVLRLGVDELIDRIATGDHRRPMTHDELRDAARARAPLFRAVADLELDASADVDHLARTVVERLG